MIAHNCRFGDFMKNAKNSAFRTKICLYSYIVRSIKITFITDECLKTLIVKLKVLGLNGA